MSRTVRAYALSLAAWVLAALLALRLGAVDQAGVDVIMQLRLPRVILAAAVGTGLAVAGAALQALFSNPLCEPYTLGISSGSAVGAVVGGALGLEWSTSGLTGTAFLGALVFSAVLYLVSLRRSADNLTLLLGGVMLGLVGSSMVTLWMAIADPRGIQGAIFWLLGDLSRARLKGALFAAGAVAIFTFLIWSGWRSLDALLMGEEDALSLGVSVRAARRRLIVLSSLLVAICVSASGMIGFVGLVIPHFARRVVGSLHLALIPLCAIWGAAALTLADGIARWAARPYEVPVGVVTALVGAPIFLWIMLKRPGSA